MLKAISGYRMQMTVNLTVKMIRAGESCIRDNGLQVSFIIEWE